MSDTNPAPATDAAVAFDGLRQEVKLLRKAVAAWVDEQPDPPDYSETLGKIAGDLSRTSNRVGWLTQRPALALTPDELALRIKAAGEDARSADRKLVAEAMDGLQRATEALSGWTVQARTADLQERRLLQVGAIAGGLSLALGFILPLVVVRTAPESWNWPERAAAFVLHADRWEAGERLLASSDPGRWRELQTSMAVVHQCRDAVRHDPIDGPHPNGKSVRSPEHHIPEWSLGSRLRHRSDPLEAKMTH
jgi:Family of unknown function (DUF6118)